MQRKHSIASHLAHIVQDGILQKSNLQLKGRYFENSITILARVKRRKVVRAITVYAAAAFVVLELVDVITDPFGLPDWTLSGIEKTQTNQKGKKDREMLASNEWQIASYIIFQVITGLIIFHIVSRGVKVEKACLNGQ